MSKLDQFGTVVFDLDDTLYPESDYVRSGFEYLGDLVRRLYGHPFGAFLEEAQRDGASDVVGSALQASGLPLSLKEHLVTAYRYHRPQLQPYPAAVDLIARCRQRGCPLYLVTDGRSLTQRLKIEALGLSGMFDDIFISEELGRSKPDPLAFLTIQRGAPGPLVYVADNPAKDFTAPHGLGWTTIGVRHLGRRIHSLEGSNQHPTLWVDELADLLK